MPPKTNRPIAAPPPGVAPTIVEAAAPTIVESAAVDHAAGRATQSLLPAGATIAGCRLIEALKVASAEADIWKVQRESDGAICILKLYRHGVQPKGDILAALSHLRHDDIVSILETGVHQERHYELQEYIAHGSLRDQIAARVITATQARDVLTQITQALEHLHAANILHRDIKPANILVRALDPLNLILTDFGIASYSDLSLHITSAHRTAAYSAPEALTGVVSRASDWWSLGVIVLELLDGRHPFEGMDERAINFQLVSTGIRVPDSLPEEWRLLLRGLLVRDHQQRWGAAAIRDWLEGRHERLHVPQDTMGMPLPGTYRHKPYHFGGAELPDAPSLAVALAENWPDAVKHFGRGLVTDWVKSQLYDQQLANTLLDIAAEPHLDADQKLSVALLALHPEFPLVVRGEVITPEWFPLNAEAGAALLRSGIPRWYEQLRGDDWLRRLRRRRRAAWKVLDGSGVPLDQQAADSLLLGDAVRVVDTAMQQRGQWAAATHEAVEPLLTKAQLSLEEAVLLLTCDRRLLLTEEQARLQQAEDFRRAIVRRLEDHRIEYDAGKLRQALTGRREDILQRAAQIQRQFIRATRPMLERLLKKEDLTFAEALPLVVCKRHQLLDQAQAAQYVSRMDRQRIREDFEQLDIIIDWPLLDHVLEHQDLIPQLLRTHHHKFVHTRHPLLNPIFRNPHPDPRDAMLLICADHQYFLTPGQAVGSSIGGGAQRVLRGIQRHPIGVVVAAALVFPVLLYLLPPLIVVPFILLFFFVYVMASTLAPPQREGVAVKTAGTPEAESSLADGSATTRSVPPR